MHLYNLTRSISENFFYLLSKICNNFVNDKKKLTNKYISYIRPIKAHSQHCNY